MPTIYAHEGFVDFSYRLLNVPEDLRIGRSRSRQSGSKSKRKYSVTQYQSGGGSSCAHSAGSEQERSCSNCAGSWSAWSGCSNGQQTRTYSISTAASGGGSACPHSDGHSETQTCNNAVNCVGSWSAWTACSESAFTQRNLVCSSVKRELNPNLPFLGQVLARSTGRGTSK